MLGEDVKNIIRAAGVHGKSVASQNPVFRAVRLRVELAMPTRCLLRHAFWMAAILVLRGNAAYTRSNLPITKYIGRLAFNERQAHRRARTILRVVGDG